MVSTSFHTNIARPGKMVAISTQYGTTGAEFYLSSGFAKGSVLPGFIYATANTYINYPIEKDNSQVAFLIIYDGPTTIAHSTTIYPAVSLQLRPATHGGYHDSLIDSTVEAAYERIYSTAVFLAASSQAQAFIVGPIDTFKYACNYGATSSAHIDQYQNFIRMMVGYSTASTGCTHDALSTNAPGNCYYICPIQFGSTRLGT